MTELVVAASLAISLSLIVPLQSFLGNHSLYSYSPVRLLAELGVISLALAGVLFSLLKFFDRRLKGHLGSFFVAALACVYFESGFLSAGLPEINGDFMPELASVQRGVWDAAFWLALIVAFVVCTRWLRPVLHWIAAAFLLLGAVSLFDVRRDEGLAESSSSQGEEKGSGVRVNQMTVVANARYSSARNVLVFILDAFPGTVATEVVESAAEIREKFSGFTAYPRNIGMADCTKRGVPGLMTGKYYDPEEMPQAEYPLTMYGEDSFLTTYLDAGANVAFSPDLLPYGFTNLPIEKRIAHSENRSRDILALLRRSREVPYLCLFDLVAFRISPFLLKGPIVYSKIRHAVRGRHSDADFWGEANMYPTLATAPISSDLQQFLGVFHSWGAHPPWAVDQRTTVADKLTRLGALMDAYRERGLYDKSLIVVTTDHGNGTAPAQEGYPPQASAMLWVKPEGAKGKMVFSDLKTSHAKIAPLLKSACAQTLSTDEINAILHTENRIYRREEGRNQFRNYGEKR